MARIRNLDRLKAKLAAMPDRIKPPIRAALEKNADELIALQKRLVPVDEGKLQASIRKEQGPFELSVRVKAGGAATTKKIRKDSKKGAPDYDYANAVEFGTRKRKAKPFFFPAYRSLKKRMKGRVRRAASAAIEALSQPAADNGNDAGSTESEAA